MPRPQRDPKREQTWRQHIERQRASGLTVRAFCSLHKLKATSFFYWKKEIAKRDREADFSKATTTAPIAPAFVSVSIVDSPVQRSTNDNGTPIDIRLVDGQRVRVRSGCDRDLLADVLTLLRRPTKSAPAEDASC
jgi:hypothetical protein